MATLYFDADGAVVRYLWTRDHYARVAGEPVPAAWTRLDFDADSNAALAAALAASTDGYTLTAGVLARGGKSVPIAPPAADSVLAPIVSKVLAGQANLTGIDAAAAIVWLIRRAQRGRV